MENRVYRARMIARQSLSNVTPLLDDKIKTNSSSKIVQCYVGDELIGEYDSLTKCATALSMSRPMVKKAIDNGVILDNGFKLVFK